MAEKHPQYWRIKAAAVETALAKLQAQALVDAAHAKQAKALSDAGFDPAKDYVLVDADETITEKP